jgi:hypothetical protein
MSGDQATEPRMWPRADAKTRFAQKCELTNYSAFALSAVAMSFDLVFKESVVDEARPSKRHSGDEVLRREHPIQIPVIGSKGTFVLYIQNTSDLFVDVFVPEMATVSAVGLSDRQTIQLAQTWAEGRPNFPLLPANAFQ